MCAHSSALQLLVADEEIYSKDSAMDILNQIEASLAYLDTLAPSRDVENFKRMRLKLETAHRSFHQRMHKHGIFHNHTPHQHHPEHSQENL